MALATLRSHLRFIDQGTLSEPYLCLAILMKMLNIMKREPTLTVMVDFHALFDAVVHLALKVQQAVTASALPTVLWALIYTMTDDQMHSRRAVQATS